MLFAGKIMFFCSIPSPPAKNDNVALGHWLALPYDLGIARYLPHDTFGQTFLQHKQKKS
jgi:hypothetical protein